MMKEAELDYAAAVDDLLRAGGEAGIDMSLNAAAFDDQVAVFGETLMKEIAAKGYPSGTEIPWVVENLYLYGLDELVDKQDGYRSEGGRVSSSWDQAHWVIADWIANPVSMGADGGIFHSRHGEGEWRHVRIAQDLPAFFSLLSTWIHYYVVERGGDILDGTFEADREACDQADLIVASTVEADCRASARSFLIGKF